mgnify:CR=1 FL=1
MKKIVVLISGGGSNLEAIAKACQIGNIPASIELVISNQPNVKGLERAQKFHLMSKVIEHQDFNSMEELDQALNKAMEHALSKGITQVHDMGSGSWCDLAVYKRSLDKGNLKLRVKLFTWYENWRDILSYVEKNGSGNDWLKWNGIKGMMDGSLGSRTAWMNKPYLPDHKTHGKETISTMGILTIQDTINFKELLKKLSIIYEKLEILLHTILDQTKH